MFNMITVEAWNYDPPGWPRRPGTGWSLVQGYGRFYCVCPLWLRRNA